MYRSSLQRWAGKFFYSGGTRLTNNTMFTAIRRASLKSSPPLTYCSSSLFSLCVYVVSWKRTSSFLNLRKPMLFSFSFGFAAGIPSSLRTKHLAFNSMRDSTALTRFSPRAYICARLQTAGWKDENGRSGLGRSRNGSAHSATPPFFFCSIPFFADFAAGEGRVRGSLKANHATTSTSKNPKPRTQENEIVEKVADSEAVDKSRRPAKPRLIRGKGKEEMSGWGNLLRTHNFFFLFSLF